MKRKLIALLLAVLMVFTLTGPAFAENSDTTDTGTEPPEQQDTSLTTTTETVEVLEDGTTVKIVTSVTVTPSEEKTADTAAESDGEIVILYTNDVHCAVEKNIGYGGLALLKNSLLDAGKNVLLVDCGDAVQGDTIGTMSKGEYIIDIMNNIGYDIATIGNHEFDFGMEQFKKNVEKAEFPYVCCNFLDKDGKQVLDSYRIFEIAGKKVAFVGVDTPTTFTSSTPAHFKDAEGNYIFSFCEDASGQKFYDAVQQAVNGALAEGADYVVVLSHLGILAYDSPWTSSELIVNTNGIDVVLDGHSHSVIEKETVKNKDGEAVILSSTGTQLAYVGCLTIGEDGVMDTMLLDANTVDFGILNGSLKNDDGIYEFIGSINGKYSELINTVIGHTDFDLVIYDPEDTAIRLIRRQETNLGDFCADAYRIISGADIAFVNGGGIRTTIPAGDITYGSILAVHPFGNNLSVVEATGQEILDVLEFGARAVPGEFGGFLHGSGITYTVDMNVDSTVVTDEKGEFLSVAGERRIKDVKILNQSTGEYEPLDPEKLYIVAGNDYVLLNYGDGNTILADNVCLGSSIMPDVDVVITFLKENLGGVVPHEYRDPYGQGRIEIIEKSAEPAEEPEGEDSIGEDDQPMVSAPELNG